MNDNAHIIDIDHLVLTGVSPHEPIRTSALIAAEVQRALAGTEWDSLPGGVNQRGRVSGTVARSVVQALEGRE